MAEVNLPLVGKMKRGWLIAFIGIGGGLGYILYRRKQSAAPAAAATSTDPGTYGDAGINSGYDPNAIDPATGLTYAEEQSGGYLDPNTGQYVYPGATNTNAAVSAGTPVTNAEWAQQAEAELSGVADPTALSAALGKYLTGQAVTASQQSLVDQAIAFAGYPPVSGSGGFPPSVRSSPPATAGGGVTGTSSTKTVRASGTQDLSQFAHAHNTTGGDLVRLKGNAWLSRYYGKTTKIPKGDKITIQA